MALAAPPPAADQQLLEDALGRALDAGKTGPELLSALHAAAPHLEMAAMHSLLEDYKAKEDAKLFDLVAENYRDFFRIATSVEGSAEGVLDELLVCCWRRGCERCHGFLGFFVFGAFAVPTRVRPRAQSSS